MKRGLPRAIRRLISCSASRHRGSECTRHGTPHEATISAWRLSSEENKLATCADFMVNLKKSEDQKYKTISEMKNDAVNMKACIEEAVDGGDYADNMKVKEVAVLCQIMMKAME